MTPCVPLGSSAFAHRGTSTRLAARPLDAFPVVPGPALNQTARASYGACGAKPPRGCFRRRCPCRTKRMCCPAMVLHTARWILARPAALGGRICGAGIGPDESHGIKGKRPTGSAVLRECGRGIGSMAAAIGHARLLSDVARGAASGRYESALARNVPRLGARLAGVSAGVRLAAPCPPLSAPQSMMGIDHSRIEAGTDMVSCAKTGAGCCVLPSGNTTNSFGVAGPSQSMKKTTNPPAVMPQRGAACGARRLPGAAIRTATRRDDSKRRRKGAQATRGG